LTNLVLAARREMADECNEERSRAIELKRAARLIDDGVLGVHKIDKR